MALPSSPSNGQTATLNGVTYVYNSTADSWTRVPTITAGEFVSIVSDTTITANGNIRSNSGVIASNFFWANGQPFLSSGYSDANVAVYLPTHTGNITGGNITLTGNIVAGGVRSTTSATPPSNPTPGDFWYSTVDSTTFRYTNDGGTSFWLDIAGATTISNGYNLSDAVTSSVNYASMTANITAANAAIVTANVGMKSYVDARETAITSAWTANAVTQYTQISLLNANVTAANSLIASDGANIAAANAAILLRSTIASPTFTGTVTVPTLNVTGNATVTGNLSQQSAYYERFSNITQSGGNLTCNFNNGTVFFVPSITSNVTASFVNVNAIPGTVTGVTVVINQGVAPYLISNIQINGVNQSVKWAGATLPYGTASNLDIMSFSLMCLDGSTYIVQGQLGTYG